MRPLPVFYLLIIYIFIQFGWWSVLLVELNNEVASLKTEKLQSMTSHPMEFELRKAALDEKLHKRWVMVAGEGAVFLLFITFTILNVRRAILNEETLARQQKNFLLSVSHELKSPMASIRLYLQTIQKRDLEKEKFDRYVDHALRDTDRLTQLVENLLYAARLEGRIPPFQKEKLDFSYLIFSCIQKTMAVPEKAAKVIPDIQKGIEFFGDRAGLVSLFNNLLENAIRYSPDHSEIKVGMSEKDGFIKLWVEDEGPGIPKTEIKKIFSKFYRIGNEETRASKGTGLGLFIVSQVAHAHGGKVSVRNNPQKGSTFEVIFKVI